MASEFHYEYTLNDKKKKKIPQPHNFNKLNNFIGH